MPNNPRSSYSKGLHELGDGCFAYLQPDGSWGWSNAGLVVGDGASLLVDTLFDLRLTAEMLEAMSPVTTVAPIATLVNTHANGDHCYGNELVDGAEIKRIIEEIVGEIHPAQIEAEADVLALALGGRREAAVGKHRAVERRDAGVGRAVAEQRAQRVASVGSGSRSGRAQSLRPTHQRTSRRSVAACFAATSICYASRTVTEHSR